MTNEQELYKEQLLHIRDALDALVALKWAMVDVGSINDDYAAHHARFAKIVEVEEEYKAAAKALADNVEGKLP